MVTRSGTFQAEWTFCSNFQRTSRRYMGGVEFTCIFSAVLNLGEAMYYMPNHAYLLPLFARAQVDPKDDPRPSVQGAVKRSRCCTTRGIKKERKRAAPCVRRPQNCVLFSKLKMVENVNVQKRGLDRRRRRKPKPVMMAGRHS